MASSSGSSGDGSLKTTLVKSDKNQNNYERRLKMLTPNQLKNMRPPLSTISNAPSSSSGSKSIFDPVEVASSTKQVKEKSSLIKKLTNNWTTKNVNKSNAVDSNRSDIDKACVFLYSTQEDANQNKLSIKIEDEGTFILPRNPENNQSLIQFLTCGEVNGCDSNIGKFTIKNDEQVMIFGSKLSNIDNLKDIVLGNAKPHLEEVFVNSDEILSGDSTENGIKHDIKKTIKTVFGPEITLSSPSGKLTNNPAEKAPILKLYSFALEEQKIQKITDLIEIKYNDMLIKGENGVRLLPLGGKNTNTRVLVNQMIREVSHVLRSKLVKRLKDKMASHEKIGYFPIKPQRTKRQEKAKAKTKMSVISSEDSCDFMESQVMENGNGLDSFNSEKSSLTRCTPRNLSMDSEMPWEISAMEMSPFTSTNLDCSITPTDFSDEDIGTPSTQWDNKLGMVEKGSGRDGEARSGEVSRRRKDVSRSKESSEDVEIKDAKNRLTSIKRNNPHESSSAHSSNKVFVHETNVKHLSVIKRLPQYDGLSRSVDIESRQVLCLDSGNFAKNVVTSDVILVTFFAPWWRWSEDIEPQFRRAAQELGKYNITLAKVDATIEKNLVDEHSIYNLPTSLVFKRGVRVKQYCGDNTSTDIINFMRDVAGGKPSRFGKKPHSNTNQLEDKGKVQPNKNNSRHPQNISYGSTSSGQQILGPPKEDKKRDIVGDMFKAARDDGAEEVAGGSGLPGGSRLKAFTGSGFKLGADATAPSEAVEGAKVAKEPRHFVLKMWKDGFSIDEEDIRLYNDPANREFLQSVMRGAIPPELVKEAKGGEVHVDMEDHRQEDFVKPKTKPKAFGGKGNVLGSIASSIEPPASKATANPAAAEKTLPSNEIQAEGNVQLTSKETIVTKEWMGEVEGEGKMEKEGKVEEEVKVEGEREEGAATRELVRIMENESSSDNYPHSSNFSNSNQDTNYIFVANTQEVPIIENWNNGDANMTEMANFVYYVDSTVEIVADDDTLTNDAHMLNFNNDPNDFSDLMFFPNMSTS